MKAPYAGIICPIHNEVDIDKEEYMRQMAMPNAKWKCPTCRMESLFDDDRYEEINFGDSDEDR